MEIKLSDKDMASFVERDMKSFSWVLLTVLALTATLSGCPPEIFGTKILIGNLASSVADVAYVAVVESGTVN